MSGRSRACESSRGPGQSGRVEGGGVQQRRFGRRRSFLQGQNKTKSEYYKWKVKLVNHTNLNYINNDTTQIQRVKLQTIFD